MVVSIRKMLWGAFAALVVLVVLGLTVNVFVLSSERHHAFDVIQGSEPLLDAVREMDDDIDTMVGSSRGYMLTRDPRFEQQYDDAVRAFDKSANTAAAQATGDCAPRGGPLTSSNDCAKARSLASGSSRSMCSPNGWRTLYGVV